MQLPDKRMAVCCSTFRAPAASYLTLVHPPRSVTRFYEENDVRCFIGVCSYRGICVCVCVCVCVYVCVCARAGGCCYARSVFNFSEPRNHIARMHVQPCAPPGGRYRGEYSGYNGCCKHLRFSACETSSLNTLKSPQDEGTNAIGYRRKSMEYNVS